MSVLSAAVQILKKSGSPLHAKDLASQMLAEGLWKSDGKTPAARGGPQFLDRLAALLRWKASFFMPPLRWSMC